MDGDKKRSKKIMVVIPAKNEGSTIAGMIDETREVITNLGFNNVDILVVSDSSDNTMDETRRAGGIPVRGRGEGLGAAMYLGLKEAAKRKPDIIVSLDADGQFDPQEMSKVLMPVADGKADMVLGSRFLEKGLVEYKMPIVNKIGNRVLSWIVRRISGFPVTDAQTGYRAMIREVAESLEMIGSHTYVQETIIDAVKKHFKVIEVPVRFRKRTHGKSKVVASAKRYAIWTFPALVLRQGIHMMLFTLLGALLFLLGISGGLYIFYVSSFDVVKIGARIPALLFVTGLTLGGMSLFFFGFLLHTIIGIKNKVDNLSFELTYHQTKE